MSFTRGGVADDCSCALAQDVSDPTAPASNSTDSHPATHQTPFDDGGYPTFENVMSGDSNFFFM